MKFLTVPEKISRKIIIVACTSKAHDVLQLSYVLLCAFHSPLVVLIPRLTLSILIYTTSNFMINISFILKNRPWHTVNIRIHVDRQYMYINSCDV
jgi:hypothetical protein